MAQPFRAAMADQFQIRINGRPVTVRAGTVVASAIATAGINEFRRSPRGEPRAPLCGMGTCMECRVTINGYKHVQSCTRLCVEGMEVWTNE